MLQGIIDKIDAKIQETRSPLVNTVLALPLFAIVGVPVAFVAGAFVLIFTGTSPQVKQTGTLPGIIVGAIVLVIFVGWAAYGTYNTNKEMQEEAQASN